MCLDRFDASTSMEERYQYRPLDTKTPSIRLLTIFPRSHRSDGEISLTLQPFALKDSNIGARSYLPVGNPWRPEDAKYTAISYTWGTDEASHRVWIDGKPFKVRDNLWLFFEHCLDLEIGFDRPARMWIDAICIDQFNIAEKNSQVRMMDQI